MRVVVQRVALEIETLPLDPFAVLGLPRRLLVDEGQIGLRARALLRDFHPDRFFREGPAAVAQAERQTSAVNDAVRALRGLDRRAALVAGFAEDSGRSLKPPPALLERVFDWNERLDDATSPADRAAVSHEVQVARARAWQALQAGAALWDRAQETREVIPARADMPEGAAAEGALLSVLGELRYLDNLLERLDNEQQRLEAAPA